MEESDWPQVISLYPGVKHLVDVLMNPKNY